ncbi:conserved protein of unknown function [Tenacibaculum sp. 190130A14a]|uniref:Lipoprotein n=1 Tax=Tenacibaculum polynesiense TaxID=3137857 RepID=A0ABP1EWG7_9FLAO
MFHRIGILLLFVIGISCTAKKQEDKSKVVNKTNMTSVKTYADYTDLDDRATKKLKDWNEYHELKEFLGEFKSVSATEALNNALELKRLTKQLKDSSDIDIMKIPAFRARINVFENEVLRLADMTYISAIKANEVSAQIEKTLTLFGSVNAKLNNIYLKKQFDAEINLDSLFKQ